MSKFRRRSRSFLSSFTHKSRKENRQNRRRLFTERLESRELLAGDVAQNPWINEDVNASGEVSPLDALMVINALTARGEAEGDSARSYLDVNGDGQLSPIDALRVINRVLQPEGEAGPVMSYTPILLADQVVGPLLFSFQDNGANDTITRVAGSWIADGFTAGGQILVAGANNFLDVDVNRAIFTYQNPKEGTDPQTGQTVRDPNNGDPVLAFTDSNSNSQTDYPDPVVVDPDNDPNTPNSRIEFQGGDRFDVGDFSPDQNFHNNGLFTIQNVTDTTITLTSSAQLNDLTNSNASVFFRPISTVSPGSNFRVGMIVEDLRPKELTQIGAQTVTINGKTFEVEMARGPFSAYSDVVFDSSVIEAIGANVGAVNFHNFLTNEQSASFQPGMLDEIGSVTFGTPSFSPLGRGQILTWETRFRALNDTGDALIGTNGAEDLPAHDSLVFGVQAAVPESMIQFNSVTLAIATGVSAVDDSRTIAEDSGPLAISVLANDTSIDPPGATLSVTGVTQPNNAPGSVTFTSTNVTFTPPANGTGEFLFTYTATNGTDSATANVTVTVTPVNDPPVITRPGARTVAEDNPLTFTGLSIDDPEDENLSVNLSIGNGILTPSASNATVGGSGTGNVTISGTEAEVNQALNGMVYQPNLNFNGQDTLNVSASDGTNDVPATVAITVTPVNDPPVNTLPGDQTIFLGETLTFDNGNTISVADVDSNNLNVTISVDSGSLSLGAQSGTSVTTSGSAATVNTALQGLVFTPSSPSQPSTAVLTVNTSDGSASDEDSLTINVVPPTRPFAAADSFLGARGIPEDTTTPTILDVLANDLVPDGSTFEITQVSAISPANAGILTNNGDDLSFVPTANFFGQVTFTYTLESDPEGDGPSTGTVRLEVTPVNDAPMLTVPGAQTVDEDTLLSISGVSIADIDAGSGTIEVELSVADGTLTVPSGSVTVTGSGSELTVSGTLANLNAALASLTYDPDPEFSGGDTLSVVVNDNGNTGGGSLTDSETIAITVNAINDAPTITVPGAQSFITDFDNPLTSPIQVADVDAGNDAVRVTLTIADGSLSVSNTTGLTVTGNGTNSLTVEGIVSGVNSAVATLVYRTSAPGMKTLTSTVNDLGHNGGGGAKTATGATPIDVLEFVPVNLTGFVFMDSDEDGAKDSNEPGIGDVSITLSGTDFQGNPVNVTTTTDSQGKYEFSQLRPNMQGNPYILTQQQPAFVANGEGSSNQATVSIDIRGNVTIGGGTLNFAEGGFFAPFADVWTLFARSEEQETGILIGMNGQQNWSIFVGSWNTQRYDNARFTPSADGNSGTLTVFDNVLGTDRTAHVSTQDGTLTHRGTGSDRVYRIIGGSELLGSSSSSSQQQSTSEESGSPFARAVDALFAGG